LCRASTSSLLKEITTRKTWKAGIRLPQGFAGLFPR
jgi:hypothetical protein